MACLAHWALVLALLLRSQLASLPSVSRCGWTVTGAYRDFRVNFAEFVSLSPLPWLSAVVLLLPCFPFLRETVSVMIGFMHKPGSRPKPQIQSSLDSEVVCPVNKPCPVPCLPARHVSHQSDCALGGQLLQWFCTIFSSFNLESSLTNNVFKAVWSTQPSVSIAVHSDPSKWPAKQRKLVSQGRSLQHAGRQQRDRDVSSDRVP